MRMQDLTEGLGRTWESVTDGWNHLLHRAGNALTHFSHDHNQDMQAVTAASWGLLSAEVYDDADRITVRVEAPGLNAEDFDINVVNNVLVVSGEKRYEHHKTAGEYTVMERAYGHFSRSIPLGYEVEPDSASAQYKKGVLQVTLDKKPDQRRRHITVN